jgi:hypothetical protein
LILTVDIGGWYIEQCGANRIDLTQIGPAVDVAIIEAMQEARAQPRPPVPARGRAW